MRLRLKRTHIKHIYSSRDIWVGQKWHDMRWWEDVTDDYPSALEAEVALLRRVLGKDAELESTLELEG